MADVIFFSGELQPNGEIKLKRQENHLDYDPSPRRVDIIIRDRPEPTHADPVLTIFYEPKEVKRDEV